MVKCGVQVKLCREVEVDHPKRKASNVMSCLEEKNHTSINNCHLVTHCNALDRLSIALVKYCTEP